MILAAAAGLLGLASGIGCAKGEPRTARPNIALILIDTLRKDHVGAYGYERNTTPTIDRLADAGLLFENPISQSSWTLPSLASLFTSQLPPETAQTPSGIRTIRDDSETLAEVLRNTGYDTISIGTNPYNSPAFRLTKGFAATRWRASGSAGWVVESAIEQLSLRLARPEGPRSGPFFLFLHFMDVHDPRRPPPPYDTLFPTLDQVPHGPEHAGFDRFAKVVGTGSRAFDVHRSHVLALYDGALRYIDAQIERLANYLREKGLDESTVWIVTSDHGEEFWDHVALGRELGLHAYHQRDAYGVGHGHTLFPEQLEVPLIFSGPRVPRARVAEQVRLIDVMPTVLGIVDPVESPAGGLSGVDLLARWRRAELQDLPAFSETRTPTTAQRSLRAGGLQYLRLGDRELLFDWSDPDGADVSNRLPAVRADMRRNLEGTMARLQRAESEPVVLDEDVLRRLEALGYVR